MNAAPLLTLVARLLSQHRLDVVVIGNAAAALQGSPVTTMDIDFMFRRTPTNLRKLKAIADDLDATVMRPYYPASQLYRVVRDRDGLQLDFMAKVDGIRSFESLRARATTVTFSGHPIAVASLRDVIRSKERAGGNKISPCSPSFERRSMPKRTPVSARPAASRPSASRPSALKRETERALLEQIRRLLALPPHERTHFLRVRLPNGGSAV